MGVIEIMKKSFLFFFILFLFTSFLYARSLEGALIDAVNDNDYNGVKECLDSGANPDGMVSDPNVISPLGLACNQGNIDIVRLLLKKGASPNHKPEKNSSPFFYTIMGPEKPEIMQLLIDYGLNVNQIDPGQSHHAFMVVYLGHAKVLKILLDAGLNTEIKDKDGYTLADFAKKVGRQECYNLLTQKTITQDSSDVVLISYDKLLYNLTHSINDNSENTIFLNESIFIQRGKLKVYKQVPYYGVKRYLVGFNTYYYSGCFIIEIPENDSLNVSYDKLVNQDLRLCLIGYATYTEDDVEIQTYCFQIDTREIKINSLIEPEKTVETEDESRVEETVIQKEEEKTAQSTAKKKDDVINFSVLGGLSLQNYKPMIDINMKIWMFPHVFTIIQGGWTAVNSNAQKISSVSMMPEFTAGFGFNIKPFKAYQMNFFGYASAGFSYLDLDCGWIYDGKYETKSFYPMVRGCVGIDFPVNSFLLISVQNCFDYEVNLGYTDHVSIGCTFRR